MAEGEILRCPALQKSVNQFIEEQKNKRCRKLDEMLACSPSFWNPSKKALRKIEKIQLQELNDFLSEFIVTVTVSTVVRS